MMSLSRATAAHCVGDGIRRIPSVQRATNRLAVTVEHARTADQPSKHGAS